MKTAEPVKGVCRWLADEVNGCRRLMINDRAYEVEHGCLSSQSCIAFRL